MMPIAHASLHTHFYTYSHVHAHSYSHTHMHTYSHTHSHTYTSYITCTSHTSYTQPLPVGISSKTPGHPCNTQAPKHLENSSRWWDDWCWHIHIHHHHHPSPSTYHCTLITYTHQYSFTLPTDHTQGQQQQQEEKQEAKVNARQGVLISMLKKQYIHEPLDRSTFMSH